MRFFLFGFFIFFFAVFANAQTERMNIFLQVERLSEEDRLVYYSTSAMCEREASREYAEKSAVWVSSFSDSSLVGSLISRKSPLKVSSKLDEVTSSLGFHLALQKCFGNDQNQKAFFFFTLMALDASGKFASWATEISLLKALYFGTRAVYAASFSVLPMRWMWFKVFFGLVLSKPMFWKLTPSHVLLAAFSVGTAEELYLKYAEARDRMNIVTGNTKEKIEILEEEIVYFQSQIQNTTKKDEIELLQLFIRQNRESIAAVKEGLSKQK